MAIRAYTLFESFMARKYRIIILTIASYVALC